MASSRSSSPPTGWMAKLRSVGAPVSHRLRSIQAASGSAAVPANATASATRRRGGRPWERSNTHDPDSSSAVPA